MKNKLDELFLTEPNGTTSDYLKRKFLRPIHVLYICIKAHVDVSKANFRFIKEVFSICSVKKSLED